MVKGFIGLTATLGSFSGELVPGSGIFVPFASAFTFLTVMFSSFDCISILINLFDLDIVSHYTFLFIY
ncbi:hypothetical protein ACFQZ1_00355 [Bacillus sp. CGMCC 1.60114]